MEKQAVPDDSDVEALSELLEAAQKGRVQVTIGSFSGPLPPPEILRGYADALPDGPNRIVTAWEGQASHRQKLERNGQIIGASLGAGAIIAAVYCASIGQPWVGGAIVLATMVGVGASSLLNIFFRR